MAEKVTDPLLKQTLNKVEASVPEKFQKGYHQIMAAGLMAMFSKQTYHFMEEYLNELKRAEDVPKMVAHGIVKLISVVHNQSGGKLQLEAAGPAAVALMCHALEYVEQVLGIQVNKDIVAKTTHLISQGLMVFLKQASGLNDEDFKKALTPGGAQQVDPAAAPPPTAGGMVQGV